MSRQQAVVLIDALRGIGAKSVVVTSMKVDGQDVVAGYNHNCGQYFSCLSPWWLPISWHWRHFSAVLFGHLLRGDKLELSTQAAMDAVGSMVALNKDNKDKNCGLPSRNIWDCCKKHKNQYSLHLGRLSAEVLHFASTLNKKNRWKDFYGKKEIPPCRLTASK